MSEKTVMYYYSGSGNSLSVAKKVAAILGNTDIISIYNLRDDPHVPEEYTRVGIVTATWFVRPPRIVREVCQKLELARTQKVFIIATCGGYDGFVRITLREILGVKTDERIQSFMLPMPPNHIVGFSPMPDGITKRYLNHEKKATKKIAKQILDGTPTKNNKGMNPRFLHRMSRTFNGTLLGVDRDSTEGGFYTTDACTKCGTCEMLCKNGNIHMTEDGVTWGHDCQQCMACIMWCPNKAIWHPNIPEKRRRYQHPDITIEDMIQSEFYAEPSDASDTSKTSEPSDASETEE